MVASTSPRDEPAAAAGAGPAPPPPPSACPHAPVAGVVLVLIDGVGDVPGPPGGVLAGRTPLQAASTPVLDAVAATGVLGLVDPVEPGRACGSDTAHLSLLGYDPKIFYRGRGAFEAMGAGLAMGPGDIAFKCNFATVEDRGPDGMVVVSRRADRDFTADGPPLCAALDGLPIPGFPGLRVSVRYATEHRAGVVLSTGGGESSSWLSDAVTGTDPLKDGRPLLRCEAVAAGAPPPGGSAAAAASAADPARTAAAVNAVCEAFRGVLATHPVNAARAARGAPPASALLLRGCGVRVAAPPLAGGPGAAAAAAAAWSRAAVVAPTRIIRGLGASLGMALLDVPGGTGDYRTSLGGKADAAAAALLAWAAAADGADKVEEEEEEEVVVEAGQKSKPAFLLLHVKAVDDAGHDRDPGLKAAWLGAVDAMVGRLAGRLAAGGGGGQRAAPSFLLAVTGDHSTPAVFGDHSVEPVPFAAARVSDVVAALGGADRLVERYGGAGRLEPVPLGMEAVTTARDGGGGGGGAPFPPAPAFNEAAAAAGNLGRFPGSEVMALLARLGL